MTRGGQGERRRTAPGRERPAPGPATPLPPGVTLEQVVRHLHAEYGWEELARRIPVRCFQRDPSVTSSLKFLRKTPWAREQVETEYVRLARREDANPVIDALKRGQGLDVTGVTQTRLHAALAWMLRHAPQNAVNLRTYFLPTLAAVGDVNFWPDGETMPLLGRAIESSHPGEGDYESGVVAELLRRGANPNDGRYWPPLLHAVDVEGRAYRERSRAPRTDLLDLLLAHGADPAAADPRGHTALSIAQAYGLRAAVNKLGPGAQP